MNISETILKIRRNNKVQTEIKAYTNLVFFLAGLALFAIYLIVLNYRVSGTILFVASMLGFSFRCWLMLLTGWGEVFQISVNTPTWDWFRNVPPKFARYNHKLLLLLIAIVLTLFSGCLLKISINLLLQI